MTKEEWDELVLRLCLRHEWKVAFFSPENVPIVYHLRKLSEKLTACRFQPDCGMDEGRFLQVRQFLAENVCHISLKENATPDAVLAKCRELVARKGCRVFVWDPLNRFDHTPQPGQTETQDLSSMLNKLTNFVTQYHCLGILVAHPRKINRDPLTKRKPRPEMYDISGSADFYNKADYGLVVERDDDKSLARVHVEKVKFKHLGHPGAATFFYDMVSGRYNPCTELDEPDERTESWYKDILWDKNCWLEEKELFSNE